MAKPTARRGSVPPVSLVRANTVACGQRMPSVPPDQTMGIWATSEAGRVPLSMSTLRKAPSARRRVKSFTPPLPSVLPTTAITSSAANTPWSMRAARPEASLTLSSTTLRTSMAIVTPLHRPGRPVASGRPGAASRPGRPQAARNTIP